MFNTRVLQLLESPQLMNQTDLDLLKKEISDHPYVQSIRALYLLGIHKFAPESYHDELTLTAAYTTDKKILYRLINPVPKAADPLPPIPEYHAETYHTPVVENPVATAPFEPAPEIPVSETIKTDIPTLLETPIGTSEEESKETVSNELAQAVDTAPTEVPDMDAPSEATNTNGVLTGGGTPETSLENLPPNDRKTDPESAETIISNNQPEESFQPTAENAEEPVQFVENQPEIPVVETQGSETEDARLNFTETDSFLPDVSFEVSKEHSTYVGGKDRNEVPKYEPNSFESSFVPTESNHVPEELSGDSTLNFTPEVFENKETEPVVEATPVVSQPQEPAVLQPESNIPHFMNTWQNWLHQRTPGASTSNVNNESIDEFIKTNPRIRGSKEGTDYVVKENSGDLSHLMTETLAELYLKQKSYDKAEQAFEILKLKYPDRAEDFQRKIEYIHSIEK